MFDFWWLVLINKLLNYNNNTISLSSIFSLYAYIIGNTIQTIIYQDIHIIFILQQKYYKLDRKSRYLDLESGFLNLRTAAAALKLDTIKKIKVFDPADPKLEK